MLDYGVVQQGFGGTSEMTDAEREEMVEKMRRIARRLARLNRSYFVEFGPVWVTRYSKGVTDFKVVSKRFFYGKVASFNREYRLSDRGIPDMPHVHIALHMVNFLDAHPAYVWRCAIGHWLEGAGRTLKAKARNTKAIGAGVGMAAVFIIPTALSSLLTAGFVILILKLEGVLP